MKIFISNKLLSEHNDVTIKSNLFKVLEDSYGLSQHDFYLVSNGKKLQNDELLLSTKSDIHIVPRLIGGKGGFGSMLRAIGAQIEKTTNREACRDLSGRRLRDINEEQRLKNWINTQAEREKEAAERKIKKLERLCEPPKHEFKDETYDKERSELPEQVEDAVLQGMQASCSTKRKVETKAPIKKKKPKLWLDEEIGSDMSSNEDDDSDDDKNTSITKTEVASSSSLVKTGASCVSENEEVNTKESKNLIDTEDKNEEKKQQIENDEQPPKKVALCNK